MVTTLSNKPIYRMSGVGDCPRALSAERLGKEFRAAPDWLERAANEGKMHEVWIKQELRNSGFAVYDEQRELTYEADKFTLVGHIDGVVADTKDGLNKRLLEIKSMSLYEFDRWMKGKFEVFKGYAAQITCYIHCAGLHEARYIVKNRSSGYKDDFITVPPMNFFDIIRKIEEVEESVSRGELFPASYNDDSIECQRCFCSQLCVPEVILAEAQEDELFAAAVKWREGNKLSKEGENLMKEAKNVFEGHMNASKVSKFRFDDLSISFIEQHREYYDKEELLRLFRVEQLISALKFSDVKYPRITDLRKTR